MSMYTRTRNINICSIYVYRGKSVIVREHIILFLHFAKASARGILIKTTIKIRKGHWHDVNAFQNDST